MKKRNIKVLVTVAVLSASGCGMSSASATGSHEVRPGESIQKAVDAAQPGDTVVVLPGTYRESVLVTKPGLTLRGSGSRTVLRPGAKAADACAKAGNGICVQGRAGQTVDGVRVESLTVSGFKKNGVWASRTDRLTVRRVTSEHNGVWGIAQERSTRGAFTGNTARANGDAGIFIANTIDEEGGATDTRGTEARDNTLTDNRIGFTARRVRNLSVHDNTVTGNCTGVFVVGDEGKPQAGAMTIKSNAITGNNKFCSATERLPALQGSGIVLTGAADTKVRSNTVRDNSGASPMSGGVVLFKSFVGMKNTGNTISGNVVLGNKPADLANGDTGKGNSFTDNVCAKSAPAGMC
ncbi:right-handed parallel beta-helix repeat-containing protein [Streptomyces sp. NBC_01591]|uniref:right-handed parallel beta-helix repeat-containing protein n=1 Tax=Streptomyces sp. NBC_01591 TaxID=2975888 RepID=UPI002DD8896E|nr:right-handed parallel beta-helix repeat-containing protein [Streptomyces sp. NBC_01591]WSD66645.1 right-handed parallel beta-helix repeat-containing protein [Streptomyces sp. NBC_01591]